MITRNIREFYSLLKVNKPVIAIDYGNKKWGIAISTPELTIALPLTIINENNISKNIEIFVSLVKEYAPAGIVIGLPLNMDSSESDQTALVIKFAHNLLNKINLPIYLQDERLTTKAANNMLKSIGMKRKQRNLVDDSVSASMILDTVLESIKIIH